MDAIPPRRFPIRGLLICSIALLLGGFFAVTIYLPSLAITGEEFSPQLFQRRSFFYYRLPGTKIRLGSTSLGPAVSPSGTPVLTHLASKSITQWQVSRVAQGANSVELGPEILLNYLSSTNADGANRWDDWSFRKPKHAAVLWPIVQEVAIRELYFCIPDLLRVAETEKELPTLRYRLAVQCAQATLTKLKSPSDESENASRKELQTWALAKIEEVVDENSDSDMADLETLKRELASVLGR